MSIPRLTLDALVHHVEHGVPTGSFVLAVLTNDLYSAVGHADHHNLPALREIVRWLYWVPPSGCKGSVERVKAWANMDPEKRTGLLARCCTWQEFIQNETAPGDETEEEAIPQEVA